MPKTTPHQTDSPTERDRSAGSTLRLHEPNGAYKCYDPIPTPSPISPAHAAMQRSTSLDSLHNSTENSSDDGEPSSDSDSIFGLREISDAHEQQHRQSDLALLQKVDAIDDAQMYLEHSHKKCDYKDCNYKKQMGGSGEQKQSNKSARRNSITSALAMAKMETILEEPIEAKVSVKEILARFETLREAAEVFLKFKIICTLFKKRQ